MMSLESTQTQRRLMLYMPCPHQHHRTSGVPWHGNIPQPLHSWSVHPDWLCPMHELLKKDDKFSWDASYQRAFQCVKILLLMTLPSSNFDSSHPITVQVDSSQIRLGAALLQDSKHVAFTSKALTEVEHCYANTEHKMLAVVFRAEQFRTYG